MRSGLARLRPIMDNRAVGVSKINRAADGERHRRFMQRLLADLRALELMLGNGMIESGIRRCGAEQELILVDHARDPAPVGPEVLDLIDDPRVTHEIGRFNLEINLTPQPLTGPCLRDLHDELNEAIGIVRDSAHQFGAEPVLTGILPTLKLSDLCKANIVPVERYHALDALIREMRGEDYELRIKGIDELTLRHDTVMLEAANTSFQLHFQTDPEHFAAQYNLAQAIAGPVLAAAVNSPVLFGKRLWRETRIAIFQQAVDTRAKGSPDRDLVARVHFGEAWVEQSPIQIFRNDVARFRVFFGDDSNEDPVALVERGEAPRLHALTAHNSTVWRWNRVCYGLSEGHPHIRIENRVFPAGPTVADEVANAALWLGLMGTAHRTGRDVPDRLDFDSARANFNAAAHEGLRAQFEWLDGRTRPAGELLLDTLIPLARQGLEELGVDAEDADRYLDIVRRRVESGQTGSTWLLKSHAGMKNRGTRAERLACLTRAMLERQHTGSPVHTWELARLDEDTNPASHYARVGQFMTTDLHTVSEDEPVDLVASIMDWEKVRHIPVEDTRHRLVGIVSYRRLIRVLTDRNPGGEPIPVHEIMSPDPITVDPQTPTLDAIGLMRRHKISCLPVVDNGQLVGIVTEHDFMRVAGTLLEKCLREHLG